MPTPDALYSDIEDMFESLSGSSEHHEGYPSGNTLTRRPNVARTLLLLPSLTLSTHGRVSLQLAEALQRVLGFELTIVATSEDSEENRALDLFTRLTPDVFCLRHFLSIKDYIPFVTYLIRSRQPDHVLTYNSLWGYKVVPYLTHLFPKLRFIDFLQE